MAEDAYDVFLSYAHADAGRAVVLREALVERGLRVWFDETAIDDFAGITDSVTEGLRRSKALLSFYSAVYPTRRACQWELTAAFLAAGDRGQLGSRVLVVNPERDAKHIEPVELRDARFLVAPDSDDRAQLAELADRIARHVSGLDGPIGAVGASQARWYGYSAIGAARFVGRIVDMWRIHSALHATEVGVVSGERGGTLVQLTGLGGVGKSLLAQEYALRFGAAYPGGVFWLRAADQGEGAAQRLGQVAGRDEQILRIAIDYGLGVDGLSPEEVRAVLATALEAREAPYLWVVDDFGSEAPEELDGWLAPGPTGRTLLTTRRRDYSSLGVEVVLGVLATAEGADLLAAHLQPRSEEERDAMRSLADDLGGHALALDVAGGALRAGRGVRTIEEYRQALAQPTQDELELAANLSGHLPNGHERSIASTLLRSIRLLGESSLDFLRLAAELAADAIPAKLIVDTFALADGLTEGGARVLAIDGMDGAAVLSLSEDAGDEHGSRQVHTLVSRTVRFVDRGVLRRRQLRTAAADVLTRTLGESAQDDLGGAPSLVVHARHLAMPPHDERLARLLAMVADHDYYRGQYESSLLLQEQVEEVFQRTLGYDHRDTLTSRARVATIYGELGRLGDAIKLHTIVLGGRLRLFGRDDPDTLSSINSLGEAHRERGDLEQARGLHETAIEGYLAAESPSLFVSMNNLALTLYAQGEREEPLALQEEVVRVYRELHGEHHMTFGAIDNLAQIRWAAGDREGACALAEEAVKGHQHLLGDDHPYTLGSMVNLGSMLGELKRPAAARPIEEKAVEGYRRLFGEEHPSTLIASSNLAETFRAEGELSAARELHERVLESKRRVLSDRHPDVFISMTNLGSTFRDMGDLSAAYELQREACEGLRSTIGADHPETLIVMGVFVETLRRLGDTAGAREVSLEVLEMQRALLGEDHPDTRRTVERLAELD